MATVEERLLKAIFGEEERKPDTERIMVNGRPLSEWLEMEELYEEGGDI